MSLVPLLFRDWWGDFDRPSSLLDQHFGLGLRRDDLLSNWSNLAQSTRPVGAGYLRPWRSLVRSNSGVSNIQAEDNKVQVIWGDDHRRFHARLPSLIQRNYYSWKKACSENFDSSVRRNEWVWQQLMLTTSLSANPRCPAVHPRWDHHQDNGRCHHSGGEAWGEGGWTWLHIPLLQEEVMSTSWRSLV